MGVSENVVYPIVPNGFADHYPYEKWLFHWEYSQHFQTNPYGIVDSSSQQGTKENRFLTKHMGIRNQIPANQWGFYIIQPEQYIFIYLYIYIHAHICIYIYTYMEQIQTDGKTNQ